MSHYFDWVCRRIGIVAVPIRQDACGCAWLLDCGTQIAVCPEHGEVSKLAKDAGCKPATQAVNTAGSNPAFPTTGA